MVTLEGSPQDINSRLAAIEAVIPHLATKADIANMATKDDIAATKDDIAAIKDDIADLRVAIEKGQFSLIRWFIGVSLASMTILAAILVPLILHILNRLP